MTVAFSLACFKDVGQLVSSAAVSSLKLVVTWCVLPWGVYLQGTVQAQTCDSSIPRNTHTHVHISTHIRTLHWIPLILVTSFMPNRKTYPTPNHCQYIFDPNRNPNLNHIIHLNLNPSPKKRRSTSLWLGFIPPHHQKVSGYTREGHKLTQCLTVWSLQS